MTEKLKSAKQVHDAATRRPVGRLLFSCPCCFSLLVLPSYVLLMYKMPYLPAVSLHEMERNDNGRGIEELFKTCPNEKYYGRASLGSVCRVLRGKFRDR